MVKFYPLARFSPFFGKRVKNSSRSAFSHSAHIQTLQAGSGEEVGPKQKPHYLVLSHSPFKYKFCANPSQYDLVVVMPSRFQNAQVKDHPHIVLPIYYIHLSGNSKPTIIQHTRVTRESDSHTPDAMAQGHPKRCLPSSLPGNSMPTAQSEFCACGGFVNGPWAISQTKTLKPAPPYLRAKLFYAISHVDI